MGQTSSASARGDVRPEGSGARLLVFPAGLTPRQRGHHMAREAPEALELACTEYLQHVVPEFLNEEYDHAMRSAPAAEQRRYEQFLAALTAVFVQHTAREVSAASVPSDLREEMLGLAEEARRLNPRTAVTWERLMALNAGVDYLLSLVYTGRVVGVLKAVVPEALRPAVAEMAAKALRPPDMCNVLMAGRFYARDFQFVNARYFDRIAVVAVYPLADRTQWCLTVPGCVGAYSTGALLHDGSCVAAGLNLVRSARCRVFRASVPSTHLVRQLAGVFGGAGDAARYLERLTHEVPWVYTFMDSSGDALVCEADAAGGEAAAAEFARAGHVLRHGHAADRFRRMGRRALADEAARQSMHEFNREAYRGAGYSYAAGDLPETWQEEQVLKAAVLNNWFPVVTERPDVLVAGNFFVLPRRRHGQMSAWPNLLERGSCAPVWRYEQLLAAAERHGGGAMSLEQAKDCIQFLSPWHERDHPQNTVKGRAALVPADVPIDGALTVFDLRDGTLHVKSGRWGNDWLALRLRQATRR